MKKIFTVLLAVAVFAPASVMAQYKPNQKPSQPAHNGPVVHPGNNNGGIHSQPGNNNGNNGGWSHGGSSNNNNNNNGNNGGYNNNNGNNNGSNGGYNNNNGNNNGSNGGYNNNHGNNNGSNGGYNNNHGNNNGSNGGYNNNHGNNGGHNNHGNHGPAVNYELINAHRSIERAFRTVENSYFPIFMSNDDKRRMGHAIGMLSSELSGMMRLVDRRHRDEIRDIALIVERAKFSMFSENDTRAAYRKIQRAENRYNLVAGMFTRL